MKYIDLINDSRFKFLLDKYLNKESNVNYIDYFNHFLDNLNEKEIIIPVLGIQGAGKSSFLNSILMKENILPTDVDETTCVPVEVRYGIDTDKAIVYFLDKECKEIKLVELEKYVHNDYNVANELKVCKIVLYNESEILKNNVVLVDLPGVGSLTPENQRTTLDYVNKLVSGIFMLRTNPPITRTERNFINALWPKLSNTIFVQNKWNDENNEDAFEAKEHNEYVLNGICKEHNESREINVNVVNIYEAVKGKFTENNILYEESGIMDVIESIKNVSKDYNLDLENSLNSKIEGTLENINIKIEEFISLCLNEKKQNELNKEEKIKRVKSILLDNKKNFRNIRTYAYEEMEKIIDYSSNIIKEKIISLRFNLKKIVNKGIVDGERLSSIYKESSDKAINDIMDEVLDKTGELIKNLNNQLKGIKIKGFYGEYENISFFNKESEFKFEKSLPSVLGVSGGVIGALGTVGTLGGPLGILVGMGIGMAFSLIGDFVRKEILETRANYTLRDLEPMLEDLESYLKEEILDDLRAKQQDMDDSIKELKKNLENSFKEDIENIEKQYDYVYNENNILEFEDDLKILNEIKEDVDF